jgi:multidrug efflux system membrane fusion protein
MVNVGLTSGTLSAVTSGVAEGELVVTDGQDKLQAGSKVEFRGGAPGSAPNDGTPAGTPAGGQGGHKGSGNRTGTPQK